MQGSSNHELAGNSNPINSRKKLKMGPIQFPHTQQMLRSLMMGRVGNSRDIDDDEPQVRKLDLNMDEKKLRRTISNRLSAHRSRKRTSQYINDMERMVKDLQGKLSVLNTKVESYKEKRKDLLLEYDSLQKLMEIRSTESRISEIEIQQKRLEICRLKEVVKISNIGSNNMNQSRCKILSRD